MPCHTNRPKPTLTASFAFNDLLDLIDNNIETFDMPDGNSSPTNAVVSLAFPSDDDLTPPTITFTNAFTPLATSSSLSEDSASQTPSELTTTPAPLPSSTYTIPTSTAPLPTATSTDYFSSSPSSTSSATENSIPTSTSPPAPLATADSQVSPPPDQSIDESTPAIKIVGIIFAIAGAFILIAFIIRSIIRYKRKRKSKINDLEQLPSQNSLNSSSKTAKSSISSRNQDKLKNQISYPITIPENSFHPFTPRPLPAGLPPRRMIPVSKPLRMTQGRRGIGSLTPSSSALTQMPTPRLPRAPKSIRTIYPPRGRTNLNSSGSSSDSMLSYPTTIESKVDPEGVAQVNAPIRLWPITESSKRTRLVKK
ncbi:uncharacterized protein MELLADRAFT_90525 [Melampsora larici-populina 98AG31]|uniref:Uncharacterized protein n=1 Tax=Melampsora larici-populina (strain 98AG31 / pathotype 3-4-7) TaxID=747676 RepID=F4RX75_MELLP|nr:uncharacterized protein MELLADRAFT_90525 [Melampsora larici-populina 98AG31]EGG02919.1 hypothetical protein MELLADRAFT_90525 [Melampsora larici-populina 98AG31]